MSASKAFVSTLDAGCVPTRADLSATPGGNITLSAGDYFLVSRADGSTPLRALRAMVGLSEDAFALALTKVVAAGLVVIEGVSPAQAAEAARADASASVPPVMDESSSASASGPRPVRRSRPDGRYSSGSHRAATVPIPEKPKKTPALSKEIVPRTWPIRFEEFMFDPALMSTGEALNDDQKQVVLYYHYHLRRVTYYDLFNLPQGATRKEIKLAYFRLSKAFHPDRWYRKDTGEFGTMIEDVFKWLNRAYGVLSSPKQRRGYDKLVSRGYVGEWELERGAAPQRRPVAKQPEMPTSESFAKVDSDARRTLQLLLAKAGQAAATGEWERACDLYERCLQVSPSAHLRIKLVECMLHANMSSHEIEQQIEAAREAKADERDVLLAEGRLAAREGDAGTAAHRFSQVLDIAPNNADALAGMAALRKDTDPAQ